MSDKKKTIIFISNESSLYGATKILYHVIHYLHTTQKYNILLICPTEGILKTTLKKNGVSVFIPECLKKYYDRISSPSHFLIQVFRRFYDNLVLFFYFFRMFKTYPDLVVYANTSVVRYVAFPALFAHAKLIWHVHEYFENSIKQKFHSILINICSDKIIFNSQAVMPHFQIYQNSASKIFFFRFLDIDKKRQNVAIRPVQPAFDILFAGRISIEKGMLDFLTAINQVVQYSIELKVCIIGTFVPKDKDKILNYYVNNKLEKYVTFHDFDPAIEKYILNSKIVVLPSYRESLGLILLEAIMLEKPVIGTTVGDIPTMISHNSNGILLDPGNIQQLTAAIIQILDDKNYHKFVAGAKEKRAEIISDAHNLGKLEEIIDKLI